jgi:rhamnosyltransferase
MLASIIIRTLNESRHLPALLESIKRQHCTPIETEVLVVDSGSTDDTVKIASRHGAKVLHIERDSFSFGRSINMGCQAASGEILVFISGHCIPVDEHWLVRLVAPLRNEDAALAYGRQIGNDESRFSEKQIFRKYFPEESQVPQREGFFANNANSALLRRIWREFPFNEELTGLEDMELAKRLVASGYRLAYVADAPVFHLHGESWSQVKRRYEREALALQSIMPEVHISFGDFLRYYASAVLLDSGAALQEKKTPRVLGEILAFRLMQFWGAYRGNHLSRKVSRQRKETYFYPK